jgi:hypothetical protein
MLIIFVSGIATGYGLAYTNNSMPVINAVYNWDINGTTVVWDSVVGCMFTLGAGVGCSIAGKIV